MGVTALDADLSNADAVEALHDRVPADAVWVMTAARSPRHGGEIREANIGIARAAARLMTRVRPSGVVFLSSIDVYGRTGLRLPLSETSTLRPQSPYAESKIVCEEILHEACSGYELPLLTLRLPGVYGPGDPNAGPVRSFAKAALGGTAIQVQGDGEQRRDLLYVEDVARMVMAWMRRPATLLTNGATGRSVSLNEMIAVVSACAGRELHVRYDEGAPQFDIVFARPRILEAYPEVVLTSIEEGIRATHTAEAARREGDVAHAG